MIGNKWTDVNGNDHWLRIRAENIKTGGCPFSGIPSFIRGILPGVEENKEGFEKALKDSVDNGIGYFNHYRLVNV